MAKNNAIETIEECMATDDAPRAKQNRLIREVYYGATEEQQAVVDEIFIALCGWKLKSIIEVL